MSNKMTAAEFIERLNNRKSDVLRHDFETMERTQELLDEAGYDTSSLPELDTFTSHELCLCEELVDIANSVRDDLFEFTWAFDMSDFAEKYYEAVEDLCDPDDFLEGEQSYGPERDVIKYYEELMEETGDEDVAKSRVFEKNA